MRYLNIRYAESYCSIQICDINLYNTRVVYFFLLLSESQAYLTQVKVHFEKIAERKHIHIYVTVKWQRINTASVERCQREHMKQNKEKGANDSEERYEWKNKKTW